jgi:hypothetical protein
MHYPSFYSEEAQELVDQFKNNFKKSEERDFIEEQNKRNNNNNYYSYAVPSTQQYFYNNNFSCGSCQPQTNSSYRTKGSRSPF